MLRGDSDLEPDCLSNLVHVEAVAQFELDSVRLLLKFLPKSVFRQVLRRLDQEGYPSALADLKHAHVDLFWNLQRIATASEYQIGVKGPCDFAAVLNDELLLEGLSKGHLDRVWHFQTNDLH